MKAIDLIKKCATLMNIKEILEDENLNNITTSNQETLKKGNHTLNRMFEILSILINDIANDHLPIIKETKIASTEKEIDLNNLVDLIKIINVKDNGFNVKYKIANDCLVLDYDAVFSITYSVSVRLEYLLDEVSVFNNALSTDLLMYGLASLYCLAVGLFEEFNVYNAIYTEKLSAVKKLQIINMPCRRWE